MAVNKTIFIGGTSYSGSTFFDMILSNDDKGFSCGEIEALFFPYREHHINPRCGCGSESCNIWNHVRQQGHKRIYDSIDIVGTDIEFLVDSSKNPFWIKEQIEIIKKKKKEYRNILIWKTPLEFAYSFKKRNQKNWDKYWIGYHQKYFAMIKEWKAISYREIIRDKSNLKAVCDYIGIDYYNEKEKYWRKTHHTLFGNNSAKIHLYSTEDNNYKKIQKEYNSQDKKLKKELIDNYRSMYYIHVNDKELISQVKSVVEKKPIINKIIRNLQLNDISNKNINTITDITVTRNRALLQLQKTKYQIKKLLRKNIKIDIKNNSE